MTYIHTYSHLSVQVMNFCSLFFYMSGVGPPGTSHRAHSLHIGKQQDPPAIFFDVANDDFPMEKI